MMRATSPLLCILVACLTAGSAEADDRKVSDLLEAPSRYWDTTVSIAGRVADRRPETVGATRGIYTVADDSGSEPIAVRTSDLPAVGQSLIVVGVVIQDPDRPDRPMLQELRRTVPRSSALLRTLLIGGGALFLLLLVVFLILLMRPPERESGRLREDARPAPPGAVTATSAAATGFETATMDTPGRNPDAQETQVFMSLGAELVVTRGPDKGRRFPLHKQIMTVGRAGGRKNDIELTDSTVSKEQAAIYFDGRNREFSIGNQSRTNPTLVDGAAVEERVALGDRSTVEMGTTVLELRPT
jgi:pSer/pThr/pTyr-binding forkhead associated (FHA) protein